MVEERFENRRLSRGGGGIFGHGIPLDHLRTSKIFNGAEVLLLLSQSLLLPLSSFLTLSLRLGLSILFIAASESVILSSIFSSELKPHCSNIL